MKKNKTKQKLILVDNYSELFINFGQKSLFI